MEPEPLVTSPPNPPSAPAPGFWDRPIRRTRSNKVAGGVVRGLADGYGFDTAVGRVVVVVAALISGVVTIPLYLALWIALPVEPAPPTSLRTVAGSWRKHWVALVLVIVAASAALNGGFASPGDFSNLAWGVLLAIVAAWLWKERKPGGQTFPWSPGAPEAGRVGEPASLVDRPSPELSPWLPGSEPWLLATQTSPQTARAVSKRKRRAPGPPVARWVWAGWLVFLGLAVAGDRLGLYSLSVSEGLAVLLGVVGAVLVVSAFRGGGRWLMPLAVVLAGSIFIARSVDWNAEYGSTTVADAAAWQGVDKGVGHVVVDLRSLDLAPSSAQVLTVPLNLGVGEVEVIVPSNVDLVVKTSIGAGEADLLDRHIEGAGLEDEWRFDVAEEVRTIELDVNIGLGRLRLTQGGLK